MTCCPVDDSAWPLQKLKLRVEDPPNRRHLVFVGGAVLADIMKVGMTSLWCHHRHATCEQYVNREATHCTFPTPCKVSSFVRLPLFCFFFSSRNSVLYCTLLSCLVLSLMYYCGSRTSQTSGSRVKSTWRRASTASENAKDEKRRYPCASHQYSTLPCLYNFILLCS